MSINTAAVRPNGFLTDPRFQGITPFPGKMWLSSPTMHGDEQRWVDEAILTNWVSTVGANINEVEKECAAKIGRKHAAALASGTAALHMAIRLAGLRLYGAPKAGQGTLAGRKVFCSDMTFAATVNPVSYEGGEEIYIDTETDSWNMSPVALERAFERYPDVKLIVLAHLYGTPGKCDEIRAIADKHGALIVEDAAESFGSSYKGVQTGMFGDFSVISFNGNKIITGSSGGMFLTDSDEDARLIRKWSTQSRDDAAWYQHSELGYNYRMSNIIAGIVRGQLPYLEEHIAQKRAIFERYREGFRGLPVRMNPIPDNCDPNYWLSCMIIDEDAMCAQTRSENRSAYITEPGKSCPTEILAALSAFNAEGRPIWKPMHMQPIFKDCAFVPEHDYGENNSENIFRRGLCLPSDNKLTLEQQDKIIEIVRRCFQ